MKTSPIAILAALCALSAPASRLHAGAVYASDGAGGDLFGQSVSQSGSTGLVGAFQSSVGANSFQGSAYVFRNLDTAAGTVTQNAKLTASDGAPIDQFGNSVSQSGNIGLVAAYTDTIGANSFQGSAYVFRNLDTATGTVTENAKLVASDGTADDRFGTSVSQSGTIGLVGASRATIGANPTQGSAYVFRNLDTAAGTVTQNTKLIASDGAANDHFGTSVSLSGNIGVVTAALDTIGANSSQGSAYVFRNLDTSTGTVNQNAKLISSDGTTGDRFGVSVSLSGNMGLVGAFSGDIGANSSQGSAYVFRDLDTATGTVTQNAKLIASDGAAFDVFGYSVSQSGSIGLVGAVFDDIGANSDQGSVYVFGNLNTATGTVMENVKLIASDGAAYDNFGRSVSLDGDNFLIGAYQGTGAVVGSGKAYTGSVSSVTTLDVGNTSGTISGISFVSQGNWVIGETTDNNQVTLSAGDSANVAAAGKQVFIGKNAGSDNNNLTIAGSVTANIVNIGSTAGNVGNTLQLDSTAIFGPVTFRLTSGNFLSIQGDYTNFGNLLTYLGTSTLQVWDGGLWNTINSGNAYSFLTSNYATGYTSIGVGSSLPVVAVPETSTWVMGFLAFGAVILLVRRKSMSHLAAVFLVAFSIASARASTVNLNISGQITSVDSQLSSYYSPNTPISVLFSYLSNQAPYPGTIAGPNASAWTSSVDVLTNGYSLSGNGTLGIWNDINFDEAAFVYLPLTGLDIAPYNSPTIYVGFMDFSASVFSDASLPPDPFPTLAQWSSGTTAFLNYEDPIANASRRVNFTINQMNVTSVPSGSPVAVPETSTWVMGFLALAASVFVIRRQETKL